MSASDSQIQARVRAWTKKPTNSIRYGLFARISDWLCAGRDAKAGMAVLLVPITDAVADDLATTATRPGGGTPGPSRWGTPRTLYLSQLGRGMADREWSLFQAEVADLQIALTMARAEQVSAIDELTRLRAKLEGVSSPTQGQLELRLGGETDTEIEVVRQRRMQDYAAARRPLENEVQRLEALVSSNDREVARVGEPVRIRFQVAQNRADMIEAYVRRRCAAYLTRLARKHPERERIGRVVRPDWPGRPSWSIGELSPDLRDVPTGQTAGRPASRSTPDAIPGAGPDETPHPAAGRGSSNQGGAFHESTMDGAA